MSVEKRILDYIEANRDKIISFMQTLIQTRSVTGYEAEIGGIVEKECKEDGLEVDIVEPLPDRVSVVAKHYGTGGGPRMMMYSHYDVVPAGDPDSWIHPAYSGVIDDGYIWGRGAQDNKVATCGLTMAYRALKEQDVKLKGDIVFTHVADEEKGGRYGFREILDRGYGDGIDLLYYAHGGSPDTIGIAANGSRGATITVKGRSAHTAQLEQGINAVVHAAGVVNELQSLADEVNSREYHLPGT
ncbi:MAG: M20/M25/M40 family metallo-hydrolase, partial [Candidatus Bathyarchaeota archaeon]|nr:M20/M25/M40 family metallo-hydrolase [Candidatus Bathyarchaeota archaeon]